MTRREERLIVIEDAMRSDDGALLYDHEVLMAEKIERALVEWERNREPSSVERDAALRAWVGYRQNGTHPFDDDHAADVDAFRRHDEVRIGLALVAARDVRVGGETT